MLDKAERIKVSKKQNKIVGGVTPDDILKARKEQTDTEKSTKSNNPFGMKGK